jgi:hypothetical protein
LTFISRTEAKSWWSQFKDDREVETVVTRCSGHAIRTSVNRKHKISSSDVTSASVVLGKQLDSSTVKHDLFLLRLKKSWKYANRKIIFNQLSQ